MKACGHSALNAKQLGLRGQQADEARRVYSRALLRAGAGGCSLTGALGPGQTHPDERVRGTGVPMSQGGLYKVLDLKTREREFSVE